MSSPLILAFPACLVQAGRLAVETGYGMSPVAIHSFPDKESLVCLPPELPEHVIFFCSLDHPNEKLVELGFAAATARELGAKQLSLVAPYLCYMRQDKAFQEGQAISQRIVGNWLGGWFDDIITVDAHLHRIHSLSDVIGPAGTFNLSTAQLWVKLLRQRNDQPILMGPDRESLQWVQKIAKATDLDYAVAHKQRLGDRTVQIKLPEMSVTDRTVILVDDVVSSGQTLAVIAVLLKEAGATHIECLVTHALFMNSAEQLLNDSGIKQIISSDSIPHSSNGVYLASLLAKTLTRDIGDYSSPGE
ncbi:MAG: ribose-phosphate diphosphokinase [Deltaproteobacteria bacterium]|nr:ribose-phosphate diphosphokinase [Deltaproteobacteria bacterium]